MLRMGFELFSGGYDQTVNLCNTGNTAWNLQNVQLIGNSQLAGLVCCQIPFGCSPYHFFINLNSEKYENPKLWTHKMILHVQVGSRLSDELL